MNGYRFALVPDTGATYVICLECERNAQAGVWLKHKPECSQYTKRKPALKVGQVMQVIHAHYPAIEKAWNEAAGL